MAKKKTPYKNSSLKLVMDYVEEKLNGETDYCHPSEILKRSINKQSENKEIEKIWNEAEALSLKCQAGEHEKLSNSTEQLHPKTHTSSDNTENYRSPNDLYMTRYWDRDNHPLDKPKL